MNLKLKKAYFYFKDKFNHKKNIFRIICFKSLTYKKRIKIYFNNMFFFCIYYSFLNI